MEIDKVPVDKGTGPDVLKKLGDNFGWEEEVVQALITLGIENLHEFRFLWATEVAIETWIGKLGLGDKALLQTARVRRAWAAVSLYYRQVEQDRSKVQLSDLDTMLGETELRDTKQQFWRRYKLRFAPEEACAHDYENYLDKLYTLLLAYAMAGCAGVTGAPEAIQENNLGADTTKFVAVPLDVVFKYFFRAKRSSAALPAHARLQWLQARDLEERSEWVSKFRESTSTLGQVIQEVYTSRDAHWAAAPVAAPLKKATEPAAGSTNSPVKPTGAPSQMTLGKPINGKSVALTMKDGTKLCAQFQRNGCKNKPCPNGAHRCAAVLRANRVCGAFNHGASACNGGRR
eukprot:s2072_g2.t1